MENVKYDVRILGGLVAKTELNHSQYLKTFTEAETWARDNIGGPGNVAEIKAFLVSGNALKWESIVAVYVNVAGQFHRSH